MKFKKITSHFAYYLFLIGIVFPSCVGDNFNFDKLETDSKIGPNFAVHMAYADLSFEDLLGTADTAATRFIELNDQGYLELYYQQSIQTLTAEQQVPVIDQYFEQSLKLEDTELANFNVALNINVDRTYDYTFAIPASPTIDAQMHIDRLTFNSGTLKVDMQSTWSIDIGILLKLPGFTRGNDTLEFDMSDLFNNPFHDEVDLSGWTLDMTKGFTDKNKIVMDYALSLNQAAGNVSSPDEEITLVVALESLKFDNAEGFFGSITYDIPEKVFPFPGANNIEGEVNLENPQFNVFYRNSFGLPVQFEFSSFYALNKNFEQVNINFIDPNLNPIALTTPSQPGIVMEDTISFNGINTTIFDVLLNFPRTVTFAGGVGLNADTDPDAYNSNFLSGDALFDITAEFRLPLSFNCKFVMRDTMPFEAFSNLGDNQNFNQVAAEIRLGLNNGFPLDLGIQIYFGDANYVVLDSLFEQFSIEGSNTDIPNHSNIVVTLSGEKVEQLKTATNLQLKATLASTGFDQGQPFVQIDDALKIGFDIAVKVDFDVDPSGFIGGGN